MHFTKNITYSRQEIHEKLGGEMETYLPQKNNNIVCGCFNLDLNHQAPYIILVGKGKKIELKAIKLSTQAQSIPVFVKQEANKWQYQGDFVCNRYSTDKEEIDVVNKISRRDEIAGIIYLKKA